MTRSCTPHSQHLGLHAFPRSPWQFAAPEGRGSHHSQLCRLGMILLLLFVGEPGKGWPCLGGNFTHTVCQCQVWVHCAQASTSPSKPAPGRYKHSHPLLAVSEKDPVLAPGRQGPAQCAPCTVSVPSRQLVLFLAGLWQPVHSLFPPHALCVMSGLRMPPLAIQTVCSTAQSWAGWKSERHKSWYSQLAEFLPERRDLLYLLSQFRWKDKETADTHEFKGNEAARTKLVRVFPITIWSSFLPSWKNLFVVCPNASITNSHTPNN